MTQRKSLDKAFEEKFVFGEGKSPEAVSASDGSSKQDSDSSPVLKESSPWADLKGPEREPTIRLNVDIPISLNDRLAAKARELRKPKTELVRHLLEWALNSSSE